MLSIPSYKSEDPNYRYKMPRLVAKVEGRGNGIKTNIVNMGDIARALKRPPEYATRFCGHELGTSSKFESNEGKAIVNGAHEQRDLQALIDKFIDKFVLCQKCSLPEIDLELRNDRVGYSCNACGDQGEVDNAHKLSTFILRNPPEKVDTTCGASGGSVQKKLSREERQKLKAVKHEKLSREDSEKGKSKKHHHHSHHNSEEDETKSEKKHRKQKSKDDKEKKKKKKSKDEDAAEEPIDELTYDSPEVQGMTKIMTDFCTVKGGEKLKALTGSDFYRELNLVRITNGAPQRVAYFVALNVLFAKDFDVPFSVEGIVSRASFLLAVARSMRARDVLSAFEEFVFRSNAMKQFPYLLQKLYDADIVEDKDLIRRYNSTKTAESATASAARTAARPFIEWLEETDGQDDDTGEEEEEDLDKAERQRLGNVTMKSLIRPAVVVAAVAPTTAADEEEIDDESDVDIDDI